MMCTVPFLKRKNSKLREKRSFCRKFKNPAEKKNCLCKNGKSMGGGAAGKKEKKR